MPALSSYTSLRVFSLLWITFLVGCMVGSFLSPGGGGVFLPAAREEVVRGDRGPPSRCATTSQQHEKEGWKAIQVFSGKRMEPDGLSHATRPEWFSQVHQDMVVIQLLRGQRNGFFVDLAANDAQELSNTLALERYYNWKGVCIEPNPQYWFDLTRKRTCQVVGAVVGKNRMEEIHFSYRGVYGGIAHKDFDNVENRFVPSETAYTVSLREVLERTETPALIDYLSLDVEGAESFIMRDFPFSSHKIKIMTVERPKDDLRELLESHGFRLMATLSAFGETLWLHQDYVGEVNLAALEPYKVPTYDDENQSA